VALAAEDGGFVLIAKEQENVWSHITENGLSSPFGFLEGHG